MIAATMPLAACRRVSEFLMPYRLRYKRRATSAVRSASASRRAATDGQRVGAYRNDAAGMVAL